MKKLILSLVLATFTLPAMALSTDQQAKVNSAFATLQSHGIDPMVVANNISDELTLDYQWTHGTGSWTQALGDALQGKTNTHDLGSLIYSEGDKDYTTYSHSGHNYSAYGDIYATTTQVKHLGVIVDGKIDQIAPFNSWYGATRYVFNTTGVTLTDINNITAVENAAEAYFDGLWANKGQYDIFQAGAGVIESLGDETGQLIVDNAADLKDVIKNIGYQTAAAEVGKGLTDVCVTPEGAFYRIGACAILGSQFVSINADIMQIDSSSNGYNLAGATNSIHNGFYAYAGQHTDTWTNWDGSIGYGIPFDIYQRKDANGNFWGDWRTPSQLYGLGGNVTVEDLLGTYDRSLDTITDLAGALSDLNNTTTGYSLSGIDVEGYSTYMTRTVLNAAGVEITNIWVEDPTMNVAWDTSAYGYAFRIVKADGTLGGGASENYLFNSGNNSVSGGTTITRSEEILFSDIDWDIL